MSFSPARFPKLGTGATNDDFNDESFTDGVDSPLLVAVGKRHIREVRVGGGVRSPA